MSRRFRHNTQKHNPLSLKWGLAAAFIVCWIVPVVAVATIFVGLLNESYQKAQAQEIESSTRNALQQLEMRLTSAIGDSKDVSYDGIVRSAWRRYTLEADDAALYGSINDYLSQRFARDEKYKAVFISFRGDVDIESYVAAPDVPRYSFLQNYHRVVEPQILEIMDQADTEIRFIDIDGQLYMARNLLDGHFTPYASVVMMMDKDRLLQSFSGVSRRAADVITLDGVQLNQIGELPENPIPSEYSTSVDGHEVLVNVYSEKFSVWKDVPSLKYTVLGTAALVIPMLAIVIAAFYAQVSHPAEVLNDAAERVRSGERGYQIEEIAPNQEFRSLTTHFNTMSAELKNQFERLYEEQQALQQAKIKALQSQINPHFLNNTLEVINWEARMEGNERVGAMIEALSTMLDAALDRDGSGLVSLKGELAYVDAYLYIIHERLGDRFVIAKEINEDLQNVMIPKLILQPIVENAVEHDISRRGGGKLCLRVDREDDRLVLGVIHDGDLSPEDEQRIRSILDAAVQDEPTPDKTHVGLSNVARRLRMIYGETGQITLHTAEHEIRMQLSFPIDKN